MLTRPNQFVIEARSPITWLKYLYPILKEAFSIVQIAHLWKAPFNLARFILLALSTWSRMIRLVNLNRTLDTLN